MQVKKRDLLLVIGFCAVLIGLQAAFWVLPKQEFSVNEKRVLQEFPEWRWSNLWSGKWFQSIDDYLSDHFAQRDFWVGAHAYTQQAEGLNSAGKVYRGKEGWLINRPIEAGAVFEKNIQTIREFAEKHPEEDFSFLCVPTTGAIMTDKLPDLHESYPDAALLQQMEAEYAGTMQWIDVMEVLQNATDTPIYYRTDHHWTSLGAYEVYCALAQAWGLTSAEKEEYSIDDYDGFYGTTYSKSGLWATKPDEISLWTDTETQIDVTAYDENRPVPIEQEGPFFLQHLQEADKYPVFLDGNHAKVTLTSNAPGGKLLIVRDSFAHCFAPFLSRHYQTIDLVDLRYFKKQTVSELIEENEYDRILFVYGLETLTSDRSIQWLA